MIYAFFSPPKKCSKISGRYENWYILFSVFWQHMSKHLKTMYLKINYLGVYKKKNFEFIQKDICEIMEPRSISHHSKANSHNKNSHNTQKYQVYSKTNMLRRWEPLSSFPGKEIKTKSYLAECAEL